MKEITAGMIRREKSARASALGELLPPITHVGWGDEGHDFDTGDPIVPSEDATSAYGEFLKKEIDNVEVNGNIVSILVTLLPDEGNGRNVSSCALYDEDGDIVVISNFRPKVKTEDDTFETTWTEEH